MNGLYSITLVLLGWLEWWTIFIGNTYWYNYFVMFESKELIVRLVVQDWYHKNAINNLSADTHLYTLTDSLTHSHSHNNTYFEKVISTITRCQAHSMPGLKNWSSKVYLKLTTHKEDNSHTSLASEITIIYRVHRILTKLICIEHNSYEI